MPKVPVTDLKEYFISHKTKHKRITEIFAAICRIPVDDIKDVETGRSSESEPDKISDWGIIIAAAVLVIAILLGNNEPHMSLDQTRIRGFYVDISDDRVWHIPADFFASKDFKSNFEIVSLLFGEIEKCLFDNHPNTATLSIIAKELGYIP